MPEPMTEERLREAREVAWNPVYRPTANFPEHVYRHDLLRDAVHEIERLRGTTGEWRPTFVVLHEILAEHRVMMRVELNQVSPPKLFTDLMEWMATAVECETHYQRERAGQAEIEAARLRKQLRADPICGTYYPAAEASTAAETRVQAAFEASEGGDDV